MIWVCDATSNKLHTSILLGKFVCGTAYNKLHIWLGFGVWRRIQYIYEEQLGYWLGRRQV